MASNGPRHPSDVDASTVAEARAPDRRKTAEPTDEAVDLSAGLRELTRLVLEVRSLQEHIATLGRKLRSDGATWQALAKAAGISQQAAYQRWSQDGNRRHRDLQRARARSERHNERAD